MRDIHQMLDDARVTLGGDGHHELARDMASLQNIALRFIKQVAELSAFGDGMVRDPKSGEVLEPGFEHDTGDSLDCLDNLIHAARKLCGKPHDASQAEAFLYNAG